MARNAPSFDPLAVLGNILLAASLFLAFVGFFTAFIGNGPGSAVGTPWFSIFLQLILIAVVYYTSSIGSLAVHRWSLSIWTAVALVFAVQGVNSGIYGTLPDGSASKAMGAGWLMLCFVDIFWLLFFSSDESSTIFQTINGFSKNPNLMNKRSINISAPNAHVRHSSSVQHMTQGISSESYQNSGLGAHYSGKGGLEGQMMRGSTTSIASAQSNTDMAPVGYRPPQTFGNTGRVASPAGRPGAGPAAEPLMGTVAEEGSPTMHTHSSGDAQKPIGKAKALYAYTASADDPNEISFGKGELLDILDKGGKWWTARKSDGTVGIVPSNYISQLDDL